MSLRHFWDDDVFSSLVIMGMRVGMLAAKFILSIFIARYMGLAELGIYGLIVGASGTVQAVMRGGVFTLLSRDAVRQSLPELLQHLRHYGTGILALYLLLVPVALAAGWYFDAPVFATLVLAVFFTEHLASDSFILVNNLQYPKLANFIYALQSSIWIYLFVVLAFIYPSLRSLEFMLVFWVCGGFIALAIAAWLSRRWPWKKAFAEKLEWRWYPEKIRNSFKLYLTEVLGIVIYYLDRYIVTLFLSLEMAGVYVFYSQVVTATLNLINSGVLAVYRPRLIKAHDSDHLYAFNKIFKSCLKRAMLSAVSLALLAALALPVMVKLTDNAVLIEHISLLWVMLVAMLFVVGEVSAQAGLFAMRKDRDNFIITLISLCSAVIIGSLGVITFGVYGIAVNLILASVIGMIYAHAVWEKKPPPVRRKGEIKKPQNILIISSIFFPHVFGGAEIAAYNRAKSLIRRGYNVSVATLHEKGAPPSWGELTPEGYRLYRIQTPRRYTLYERTRNVSGWSKMLWHLQDYFDRRNRILLGAVMDDARPDYIEIDNLIGLGFNALSEIARRGVPVAYILHDLNLACFNTGMIRKGKSCGRQCFFCRGVATLRQTHLNKIKRLGFISPSHANLERAKQFIPAISGSLSCVIRNIPEEIPPLPERGTSDHIRLLFAGRLDPVKGIGFLLRTLDKMSSAYRFHLTVLGTGPDEQRLKAEFGQKSWATFRGFVAKDEVATALAQSDLYCMPSLVAESYGLVTAQALQLGTPVIGSDTGGTAELVRNGVTGILLPPGNEQAWQDAFSKIFANPELLDAWRENAARHAYEFDEKAIGQAHDVFIERLSTMRVLHIVRQFYPAVGGLESYVKNMIEHQQKLGHECAVLTLNRVFHGRNNDLPSYEMVDGIPVHRVPFLGRRRFFIPMVAPSFLNNYDIIHVHNTDGFFDYISLLAGSAGRPAFATTHGGFFHTNDFLAIKKIYFGLVTRNAGRRYRALFAISRNDYRIFKGVNDNLLLKPNAIAAPGDFTAAGDDFVYLGRLAKHKNVAAIIETFASLKAGYGVAGKLHIIGPEWDVKKADLASLAASLGVEKDVSFHGFLAPEEMKKVLRGCGWFLSASAFEGFGMSMLEAMAVGLIPFVQPNESFRELIDAGGVGACVDFTRPERAAAEIAGRLGEIGSGDREKARLFALQFSWEKLAEDTIAAYRRYGR